MQPSQPPSPLNPSTFPSLTDAYTKLSSVSRNNLFKLIKYQLVILYILHFILHGLLFKDLSSNLLTGLFFISFLYISLQHSINDILHHINGAFLAIFTILIFSNGSYSYKIGMYLPQLSLIITNNKHFALFLQSILFIVSIILRFERFTTNDLHSSTLLLAALLLILVVLDKIELKNENLKAQADSLEAQLKSTQNRLQEAYNFNRDFHLTISHEFRNPLNNVMGNLDLVSKNLPVGDVNQEHVKMAKLGCEILLNSLNNTLDYCKVEFDEIDINYVSINIRKCLEKSWATLSELLRLRGLQGELYLHANVPPMVMMDPGRLHQIILNLIHNSSKFTPKGYVKIIVSWHPCYLNAEPLSRLSSQDQIPYETSATANGNGINVSTKRTATPDAAKIKRSMDMSWVEDEFSEYPYSSQKITFSPSMNYNKLDMQTKKFPRMRRTIPNIDEAIGFLKVQVLDSGVGIHKSNLPKVFQKFSKFSHDSIPRVEGSGLGLWVTKKICNKMDGTIHVESDLNKGSTFIVFIKCEISPQSIGTPTPSPCMSGRRSNLQSMGSLPFLGMMKPRSEMSSQKPENSKVVEEIKLKAMVVDDIPYNQQLNKQFLELCGVEVTHIAGNGQEAYKNYVSSYKDDPIDLIFMDLDMPVMDGKTSSAKIREWEKNHKAKPVVIVILTGNCSENELKLCLDKMGSIRADYFYRKPLPLPDCQNLIQQIKREKTKKKNLIINLPKLADQVLICEKDLFQQVLLENYLRVGQIKYYVANKDTVYEKLTKYADSICAILYNCESSTDFEECRRFTMKAQEFMRKNGRKEIPMLGIVKEADREEMTKLRQIGFADFLVKPFDFQNIVKLLRSHTMNGLFV